jgi:hypothetical protein
MRTVVRRTVAVALLVVSSASTAAATPFAPDIVKGTRAFEGYGAATHIGSRRLFAWSNETGRRGQGLAAFSEVNGAQVTRISAKRTTAYVGGFDPRTDRVIYQQVRRGESDLFLYDTGAGTRTPLRALNDGHWQWNPSIDTHDGVPWIVYGVNRFGSPTAKWRFFLYNGKTGERTLLDETTNRCGCLFPGTIAYPWVTWAVGEDATAWRYDIRTGERSPLLPTDRDEYGVTVTADGTAYVAQAGDRCGSRAKLYRVDRNGTPFLLHAFGAGREASNLSVDWARHDRLYFDRRVCRTGRSDIMRLRQADVGGRPASPMRLTTGASNDGPRRWEASSGATPRTR